MIKYITLLFILFFLSNDINSQGFNSITTPDGNNIIAVGNSGKIYRSANGGVLYAEYIIGGLNLYSVTSFGNDVWIAGQGGNIYKTLKTDSPIYTYNVGSAVGLNSITFINSNTGFTCGDNGSVYKSTNGGINWSISNSGVSSVKLNSISFKDVNNGTIVGDNGKVYVTNNGGASWTSQISGTTRNLLKVKYFTDSLIAVGEYGTILTNTKGSWTDIVTRTTSDIRGVSGTNTSDIHVCGGGGFIRNNRNGSGKYLNFEINPMMANLVDIFYYGYNKGFAVSSLNNVIIYTTNGGLNWNMPTGAKVSFSWIQKIPSGGGIGNNLCMHPLNRNSMFVVYGSTVYVSRDRGDTWTNIATVSTGGSAHSFYVSPVDTNIWLCASSGSPTDRVARSTNYGATWTTIISYDFSTYGQPLEMDQNDPRIFYFAPSNFSGTGLFKSTDNGSSFNLIAPYNQSGIGSPCDVIVMWDSSSVIYLGDDGADIWKSNNGGVNWNLVKPGTAAEIPSMCNSVFDKSICYATTFGGNQFYRTVNHGDSWSIVSNNGGSGWGSDLCHEDPTLVLNGTYGTQAYLTTNAGSSFFSVNTGLSGAGAGMMVPERGILINMQTGSLFKLNISYTDSTVQASTDVQALSLVNTGTQYFETATINPTGIVKNNNGLASATFIVIRKINPGSYVSMKNIFNLAPGSEITVTFNPWTFNSGTTYTIKDSVYVLDDANPTNDVLNGTLTPYVGTTSQIVEGFTQAVFPPAGWNIIYTGTNHWSRNTVSSYGLGIGSAKFNFFSASNGTNQSLESYLFNTPTIAGDTLAFDNAYAPYLDSSVDSLLIETSTNGGGIFSTLVRLWGAQGGGPLNTAPAQANVYTPSASQWQTKRYALPTGTNKIRFRARSGFGNNLYLDSVRIGTAGLYTQFNVKVTPEGLYNGAAKNIKDTVRIYLRNNTPPFSKVDSAITLIDSITLVAPCVFKNTTSGTYYLQVIHRNSIETWSKSGGETFTTGLKGNYDFTSSQSQAFGNNLVLKEGTWCIYSGDTDKNGVIDLTDLSSGDNDVFYFATGYLLTDLNGDGIVDSSDLIIIDNNAYNYVARIIP
ncbi:MAG: hypothetical protein M3R36_01925 [Bacteroidota bacterium]|nr:hypothetical protein [Bacteroidota bacterium]